MRLSVPVLLVCAAVALADTKRSLPTFDSPLSPKQDTTTFADIVRSDHARIDTLLARAEGILSGTSGESWKRSGASTAYATNNMFRYMIQVNVGQPPTVHSLLIDTGSANLWVGKEKHYQSSRTSRPTGNRFECRYGSGSAKGFEYIDRVALSGPLTAEKQSIGAATSSTGFSRGMDGILGLGPVELTRGTVKNRQHVPPLSTSLYEERRVAWDAVGVAFIPVGTRDTTRSEEGAQGKVEGKRDKTGAGVEGALTFGGYDRARFKGKLTWVPRSRASPAKVYWAIEQALHYDGKIIMHSNPGILDVGTTLQYVASDVFEEYKRRTGAVIDKHSGFLTVTTAQFNALKDLHFVINNRVFTMTPNAQAWPRAFNKQMGGQAHLIYLVIGDLGRRSGKGLDFINGLVWSERFYSVYDTGNNGIWVGESKYWDATTN